MINISEVNDKKGLKKFINVAWNIYKNDKNWVPPLKRSLLKTLSGIDNPLFENGSYTFFIAEKNGTPVGRLLTGVNDKLNREKEKNEGYISLFECIDDENTAFHLLDRAIQWLRNKGVESVTGPVSPTGGDDYRGFLIKGFDGPPVLLNSYNPEYYPELFEKYGFRKDMDLFAYYLDPDSLAEERYKRVIKYAMQRYGYRIDRFDKKHLEREIKDIKEILDLAMPETWEHLTPPSLEDIRLEVNQLMKFMDEDLVYIARAGEKPIGIVVALPDYNQVLARLNGRLLPFGFLKFLWYRKKINGARVFIQFVIPKYRNKGVNNSIYFKLMTEGRKKGYTYGEGSCIAEMNTESIQNVENLGGRLYRIYRIFRKELA